MSVTVTAVRAILVDTDLAAATDVLKTLINVYTAGVRRGKHARHTMKQEGET